MLLLLSTVIVLAAVPSCQRGLDRRSPPVSCTPICDGLVCGEDGCGGTCGDCPSGRACEPMSGVCVGGDAGLVQGRLTFEYLPGEVDSIGAASLGKVDVLPGRFMSAAVLTSDGTVIGAGSVTGRDGSFAIPVSQPLDGTEALVFTAVWAPEGEVFLALVHPEFLPPPAATLYRPWSWAVQVPASGQTGDLLVAMNQGSGAMFAFLMNQLAMKWVLDHVLGHLGMNLVRLAILWKPYVMFSCGACYASRQQTELEGGIRLRQTIYISDEPMGSSAWGWPVLLHEFGHYIAANYSRDDSVGGPHFVGQPLDPRFAWSEGWATFAGIAVGTAWFGRPMPLYWDIASSYWFWIDFDESTRGTSWGGVSNTIPRPNPTKGMDQKVDESYVTEVLWRLWDGSADDPEDPGVLSIAEILRALSSPRMIDKEDRGGNWTDLVDFLDAVVCELPDDRRSAFVNRVIDHAGFPYDDAPSCVPDNRPIYSPLVASDPRDWGPKDISWELSPRHLDAPIFRPIPHHMAGDTLVTSAVFLDAPTGAAP